MIIVVEKVLIGSGIRLKEFDKKFGDGMVNEVEVIVWKVFENNCKEILIMG